MFKQLLFVSFLIAVTHTAIAQQRTGYLPCSHRNTPLPCYKNGETAKMQAANSRSDTLDVLHYAIHLTLTNFSAQTIGGYTDVTLVPKLPAVEQVLLDLENMSVSAVEVNGAAVAFSYTSPLLRVNLSAPASPADTLVVRVYYSGNPVTASFGGFYFTSVYAYNLGVGIGVDPPNFGRAWFPCFDNFVERSTYSFYITTAANYKAFCGGLLQNTTTNPDGTKTWYWELSETIPTYLASVAVSDYATVSYLYDGENGQIPVQLGARATDTVNLKNSFVHLPDAIHAFEDAWGPYRFGRVGFVVVPFNGGAMEHATNIAYPLFAVNGNLQWESLMAHEFSHHWFGDLVTCETAPDMWINEGWASYNERVFLEYVYGKTAYKTDIRENHRNVLLYANVQDGQYLPVSGVPFEATYGSHVYNKGADVAHTLRGYMGDSLFFGCLKEFLSEYAFRNVNSYEMSDFLSGCSGIDLTDFFDDWVFSPGFPHFGIDSVKVEVDELGNYQTSVYVRQRLYAAPHFYNSVPLEITFFDYALNPHTEVMTINGACTVQQFTLPFYPVLAIADLEERLSDATLDNYRMINSIGTAEFPETGVTVEIAAVTDSALVRISNNMVMPDRLQTPVDNLILSPNRYWSVEGYATGTLNASAEFTYNGTASTNGGYLDNQLITVSETNLRLLYRPTAAADWQVLSGVTQLPGASNTDKRGALRMNNLQFGEYALGIIDPSRTDTLSTFLPDCISVNTPPQPAVSNNAKPVFIAYPNPAKNLLNIVLLKHLSGLHAINLYNMQGILLKTLPVVSGSPSVVIDADQLPNGTYVVQLVNKESGGKIAEQKVTIQGK